MTAESILLLILQAAGLLVAILAVMLPVLENNRKKTVSEIKAVRTEMKAELDKQAAEHMSELRSMEAKHERSMSALETMIVEERRNREAGMARIQDRFDGLQTGLVERLRGDISKIDGKVEGLKNLLNPVAEWFINGGPTKGRE
jgi:hypothetical protein